MTTSAGGATDPLVPMKSCRERLEAMDLSVANCECHNQMVDGNLVGDVDGF